MYLSEFARKNGKFDDFHKLVFDSYWKDGKDIGDQALLMGLAETVGLNRNDMLEYINSEEPKSELTKSLKDLKQYGINGVPTFIIGDKIVVGAQPYDVFKKVIENILQNEVVI